ncbi:MAG: hypothetical protein HC815_33370 [Richelia sp. RM1_1_1]|nr:hypothetical protein [Richelia sp. RM1_1_1]
MFNKIKLASLIAFISVIYPVSFANSKTQTQNYSSLNHFIAQGLNTQQVLKQEAFRLNKIGIQYLNISKYREALMTFDNLLVIVKKLGGIKEKHQLFII